MKKNKFLFYLFAISSSCCIVCLVAVIAIASAPEIMPSQTPQAQISIEQIIINTSAAAQTQTRAVQSSTPIPSFTPFEYTTPSAFIQPTIAPTWTPEPTATLFILTLVTFSVGDSGGQCVCDHDTYNCGDALEQVCFAACNAQGAGDIHRLDNNNNGIACDNP